MYKNRDMPGLCLYVNYIIATEPKGQTVNGTWWRRDDATKKLVSMDIEQEVFIASNSSIWDPIDEGRW